MVILGISAFYHNSAACIIVDGQIAAACEEERFSRVKNDHSFPAAAVKACLKIAELEANDLDWVVFYEKPILKFDRIVETCLAFAPSGFKQFREALPLWVSGKIFQKSTLIRMLKQSINLHIDWDNKLLFSDHHLSHAASAFFPSPFDRAAILTLDGVGEWSTATQALGSDATIEMLSEINFPHSLGLLYSAFTQYLGFKVNSGEYKLMGLAPYGNAKFVDTIMNNIVDVCDDGSFWLNLKYFSYCSENKMINKKFSGLFGLPPRIPEAELNQFHADIAASIQNVLNIIISKIAQNLASLTSEKNLCLAGGVALNCVANNVIRQSKIFENVWVQPASGDAGGAIGAALAVYHMGLAQRRKMVVGADLMEGALLGPKFSADDIGSALINNSDEIMFTYEEDGELFDIIAEELANDKIVAWFSGQMEFGPRALGSRSILANPKAPNMRQNLNEKIKFRETFRPFAPAVLEEHLADWFEVDVPCRYMSFTSPVKSSKCLNELKWSDIRSIQEKIDARVSVIPAVTHYDGSARVQSVNRELNSRFYDLINSFYKKTDCPILVNTSFNLRGQPIVCSPQDAIDCFLETNIDILVLENFVVTKKVSFQLG